MNKRIKKKLELKRTSERLDIEITNLKRHNEKNIKEIALLTNKCNFNIDKLTQTRVELKDVENLALERIYKLEKANEELLSSLKLVDSNSLNNKENSKKLYYFSILQDKKIKEIEKNTKIQNVTIWLLLATTLILLLTII